MCRLRILGALFLLGTSALAQEVTLHGRVEIVHRSKNRSGSSGVVVWLTSLGASIPSIPAPPGRLVQKEKRFSPHVLVVPVGTEIEFPNQDPFFHDVFSIYRGRPFDLGLYESGTTRRIRFSQVGVSYIFCNIHPEMSAAVVAVPTPYFALTNGDGAFQIGHLRPGHYKIEFWYEMASETELAALSRDIEVGPENPPFGFTLHSSDVPVQHLNKYGQEYSPELPKSY